MISIIPIRSTFCLFSNHRLLHISHRGTNISNVTGSSSFIVPLLQIFSGSLSRGHYPAPYATAHDPAHHTMSEVSLGWSVRWPHRLGALLPMVSSSIHASRGVRSRSRMIDPMSVTWIPGLFSSFVSPIEGSLGYTLNSGQMPYRGYMVLSGLPSIMGVSERSTIEMSWRSSHAASFRTSLLHSVIGRSIGVPIAPHIVVPHGLGDHHSPIY